MSEVSGYLARTQREGSEHLGPSEKQRECHWRRARHSRAPPPTRLSRGRQLVAAAQSTVMPRQRLTPDGEARQVSGAARPLQVDSSRAISAEHVIARAKAMHTPIATICLFSGGSDSTVLAHRCRDDYELLAFIDTGTALPGVREFVGEFAARIDKPLKIVEARDAYRHMVLGTGKPRTRGRNAGMPSPPLGFPGPAQHGRAYTQREVPRASLTGHQAGAPAYEPSPRSFRRPARRISSTEGKDAAHKAWLACILRPADRLERSRYSQLSDVAQPPAVRCRGADPSVRRMQLRSLRRSRRARNAEVPVARVVRPHDR
jgi:hypothetical protein